MQELIHTYPKLIVDLSHYAIDNLISKNSHSEVYLATENSTRNKVIIKKFLAQKLDEAFETGFSLEASIPLKVGSPFVVKTLGFTNIPPYSIIQDYHPNKSLSDVIYKSSFYLTPTHKMLISMCLAQALSKMHRLSIVYRNLTSEHILIDQYLLPHLSSFGSCQHAEGKSVKEFQDMFYIAPELLSGQKYSEKVDVFSYGMVLYELVVNHKPFEKSSPIEVQYNLLSKDISFPEIPNETPPQLRELILSCWSVDFTKRPSFLEIYQKFSQKEVYFDGFDPSAIDSVIRSIDNNVEPVIPPWGTKNDFRVINSVFENAKTIYKSFKTQSLVMLTDLFLCANSSNVLSFFGVLLNIIRKDEDSSLVVTAVSSVLHLMSQDPVFLDYFIRRGLYQQLPFDKISSAKSILSLLIPVFQVNPKLATPDIIRKVESNVQICPVKVFRVFATVCNRFTEDWINWQIIDLLFIHGKTFLDCKAGAPFLYLFYRLFSLFEVIKAARGLIYIKMIQYALRSQDQKTVKAAYSIILALNLVWIKSDYISDHLLKDNIQEIALNYLCSAPLSMITTPVIKSLCTIKNSPLAASLLIKFAQDVSVTQRLLTLGPYLKDVESKYLVKILIEIMIPPNNRLQLMNMKELPYMLAKIASVNDSKMIEAVSKIIKSLPLNQDFLVRIGQTNFLQIFITQAVKCGTFQSHVACLITIDRLIRFGYLPEFASYMETAINLLSRAPQLTVHVITYLSLLSANDESLSLIKKNPKIPQIIQQYQNNPQCQKQIEFLQSNISSIQSAPA